VCYICRLELQTGRLPGSAHAGYVGFRRKTSLTDKAKTGLFKTES